MSTPSTPEPFKEIIDEAEATKKKADIAFAKGEYEEAIRTYDLALQGLVRIKSAPQAEAVVVKCFANQSQCFLKLSAFDRALLACDVGISIPVVAQDAHMLSKLWVRKSAALESLGRLEEALAALDHALSLGVAVTNADEIRRRIIASITTQGSIVALPPKPQPLDEEIVDRLITTILDSDGHPDVVIPALDEVSMTRGWFDKCDPDGRNLVWALAQMTIKRSSLPSKDPDVVAPSLQAIFQYRARAEQRYSNQNNRTPLQMMALAGAVECIRATVRAGAGVDTCDNDGWTPLVVACSPNGPVAGENLEAIKVLVELRADVNYRTKSGLTPLSAAAQSGDLEAVQWLITAGAKADVRCNMGFSAVTWAKIGSRGNDSSIVRTVFDAAVAQGNEKLFNELNEDIRCFDISMLISALKQCFEMTKMKLLAHSEDQHDPLTLRRAVEVKLVDLLRVALHIGDETPENEVLRKYHESIAKLIPKIFSKKWRPKSEQPSFFEAFVAAEPIERALLNILTTALFGPPKPGSAPPLLTRETFDFYYVRMYEEFRVLVQDPLSRLYAPSVPSDLAIATIAAFGKIADVRLATGKETLHAAVELETDAVEDLEGGVGSQADNHRRYYHYDYWSKQLVDAGASVEVIQALASGVKATLPESAKLTLASMPRADHALLLIVGQLIPSYLAEVPFHSPGVAPTIDGLAETLIQSFVVADGTSAVVVGPVLEEENNQPISNEDHLVVMLMRAVVAKLEKGSFQLSRGLPLPSWLWMEQSVQIFVKAQ